MADGHREQKAKDTPFTPRFDELVKQSLDKWKVPGISIAVINGNETFAKGYGVSTYPDTPVTADTLFYGGSTTKAFLAAAVSLLVDDDDTYKHVQWTTPINSLIRDDFLLMDEYWTSHITFEDALSHRTGMSRHDRAYGGEGCTLQSIVRSLRHLPLGYVPRTQFDYCNTIFIVVSHAVETVTGESLGDFLARRIWKPLDMQSTFSTLDAAERSGMPLASGYNWDEDSRKHVLLPRMVIPQISGAGYMISNVLDYAKWIRVMMNKGAPISEAGHTNLVKPRIFVDSDLPASMPAWFYALGWMTTWYHGEQVIWHEGGLLGFGALVFFLPQRSWGCAMLGNIGQGRANAVEGKVMWHLIDELLDVPQSNRFDWEEKYSKDLEKPKELYDNARDRLYPHAGSLPHSLSLESYAGSYMHPAYRTFVIGIKDGTLHANVTDRIWPFELDFAHVSGEYFIAYDQNGVFHEAIKADFEVGADGKVQAMGLFLDGARIRFDRLE